MNDEKNISDVIIETLHEAFRIQDENNGISISDLLFLYFNKMAQKLKDDNTYELSEMILGIISIVWISHTLPIGARSNEAERRTLMDIGIAVSTYNKIMQAFRSLRDAEISDKEFDVMDLFKNLKSKKGDDING